jgi:DNA-binding Xre family transcriptional regulator
MKTNKKAIGTQRRLMDKKTQPWISLRSEKRPPIGWLKAIRGALGISSRQLAQIVGIDSAAVIRLEDREPTGKITLELLDRAAQAMGCKVVYAIVPNEGENFFLVESRGKSV